jgi:hypothetical protein
MEAVRYRPGEALRWLETGAEAQRKSARDKGRSVLNGTGELSGKAIKDSVSSAAGALVDLGKGAYADLVKRQADAYEIILSENEFSVSRPTGPRIYRYADVTKITQEKDRITVTMGQTNLTIRPYAYITAGRVKVPIGWDRNGMEVPFELLVEELAARCRVEIDQI